MKQCAGCCEIKSYDEFHKNKNLRDGYQSRCKVCMRYAYNTSRNKKKDHYNIVKRARHNSLRDQFRDWKQERGCTHCNEDDPCCLDLHHPDPSTKERTISDLLSRASGWDSIMNEANKCIVLCRNCHAKTHAGNVEYAAYIQT